MNASDTAEAPPAWPESAQQGWVTSLHLHPAQPGEPLRPVESVELVHDKGVVGDCRYFGRLSQQTGAPTRRQVSLIEREQIARHAQALGLACIPPGAVRSNFETSGINLADWLGREIEVGEAILLLHSLREPCAKMDAVCQGLRQRMLDGRQGVLAQVRRAGRIRIGDPIRPH
jgi:MOSC domain-containing protein YiiM